MESQQPAIVISDKELALRKMGLRLRKDKVKTKKAKDPRTLRCHVPMIIKEVSTTITVAPESTNPTIEEDQGPPAPLERSTAT